jgi:hypothetical protein
VRVDSPPALLDTLREMAERCRTLLAAQGGG